MSLIIEVIKAGTKSSIGPTLKEDAIFVVLQGENIKDHPELERIQTNDPSVELYKPLDNLLKSVEEIVSDGGIEKLANELEKDIKDVEKWSCRDIGVTDSGTLVMRLTCQEKKLDKDNSLEIYWSKQGTKTEKGKVSKDRIYIVSKGIKPEDKELESIGNGLYKVTEHLKSWTAIDLLYKKDLKMIAQNFKRPYQEVANFQVDYIGTDRRGYIRLALAAESELWRNKNRYVHDVYIEDDEAYWDSNIERSSIPKNERKWVDETSSILGLNPEEWYWNIH